MWGRPAPVPVFLVLLALGSALTVAPSKKLLNTAKAVHGPETASSALGSGFQGAFAGQGDGKKPKKLWKSRRKRKSRLSYSQFLDATTTAEGKGQRRAEDNANDGDDERNDDAASDEDADDVVNADDDSNDDAANGDDAYGDDIYASDDDVNEACSQYLISFLEGTTDAKDTCEGIMNAYTAADCSSNKQNYNQENNYDDYFGDFAEHSCCQSLMRHHADYCEDNGILSNVHLIGASLVLLLCECAKVLVKRRDIHFLPEAAVCILVGILVGGILKLLPFANIDDMAFDDELFMSFLLPPIIFEAALSVSKSQFKRRRGAILYFAVLGTLITTFTTGLSVHYLSKMSAATTFPVLDSLVFGALISSIDPVAILSVLTSLNLSQTDTIFILVFGESLLNDGIAITVFKTLVARFDGKTNDGSTSVDEVLGALADFFLAMVGSIFIGIVCGMGAWSYFFVLKQNLHPVMEVGSFFLWALVPYYICEELGWSGIVAIVAMAFIMDIYIASPKKRSRVVEAFQNQDIYINMGSPEREKDNDVRSVKSQGTIHSIQLLAKTERINLSATADKHVRFVAHLTAQLAENAIFAYLGLFLLSGNYYWDPTLCSIAVASCILCRLLMVVVVSSIIWHTYRYRRSRAAASANSSDSIGSPKVFPMSRTATAVQDRRTQIVLVLAGLRGAVSLALVENVPIYNSVSGEGCEFKSEMKAMTSACIIFTTFVFGGGAYYLLPYLGIEPDDNNETDPQTPSSTGETTNTDHLVIGRAFSQSSSHHKEEPSLPYSPSFTPPVIGNSSSTSVHSNRGGDRGRPISPSISALLEMPQVS